MHRQDYGGGRESISRGKVIGSSARRLCAPEEAWRLLHATQAASICPPRYTEFNTFYRLIKALQDCWCVSCEVVHMAKLDKDWVDGLIPGLWARY